MPVTTSSAVQPADIVRSLREYWRLWVVPTVGLTVLAALYCLVRSPSWEASQALAIRNEAANNSEGLGRFRQLDDMKVTQETVLEIAKSRGVLSAALKEVGPPAGRDAATWPTADDVLSLRGQIALAPPKGQEFGKTEIFYLKVKDRQRERAVALVGAVSRQLRAGLQKLRHTKAQSMIDELARSADLAAADLHTSTQRLAALEAAVGSDLGELRMLDLTATGDSDLHRTLHSLENEIREARTAQQANQELLSLLTAARSDAGRLLATPNRLLESQPALRKLKDGLVEAQLRTSQILGSMTKEHPLAVAALANQEHVGQQLHAELGIAIRGVESDLRLVAGRLQMLDQQQTAIRQRLNKLAGMRAEYSSLAADMKHRTTLLEKAQTDLAEARGAQAAAHSASLISAVDLPEAGNRPVGPTAATVMATGLAGGLLTGWGLVFLLAPGMPQPAAPASAETAQSEPAVPGGRRRARRHILSLNGALTRAFPLTTIGS